MINEIQCKYRRNNFYNIEYLNESDFWIVSKRTYQLQQHLCFIHVLYHLIERIMLFTETVFALKISNIQ